VVNIAKKLKPSARNELEITDINNILLKENMLDVIMLGTGITWFDCGDAKSLLDASNFIFSIEERHGIKVGCYEESLYKMDFADKSKLLKYIESLPNSDYKNYLSGVF
jgi:glucose-1-phosphate thymidylyltransferase